MDYLVTCEGTPIGTVSIPVLAGLPHAELRPNSRYESVRSDAIAAWRRLHSLRPGVVPGDFAEWFAATWTAGRLAIEDPYGEEVAVASVMIVGYNTPRLVVDARPDAARMGAAIRPTHRGGGRSRPAA